MPADPTVWANTRDRSTPLLTFRYVVVIYVVLGMVLIGSQAWISLQFSALRGEDAATIPQILPLILLLSLPAALLFLLLQRRIRELRNPLVLAIIVLPGFGMRLVHFGSVPVLETDFHRYFWDGAMLANGIDPYRHAPVSVGASVEPIIRTLAQQGQLHLVSINFPELRTIYPGTAQLLFALAYWISPWSIDALRAILLISEVAMLALILMWLRVSGSAPGFIGLYWLNPIIVFSFANQAHIDGAMLPFVAGALLAGWRKLALTSGFLLAAAAGVKLWPVLLAPLLLRLLWSPSRLAARFLAGFAVVATVLIGPLLWSATSPDSGLLAYGSAWANNNAFYAWIDQYAAAVLPADFFSALLLRSILAMAVVMVALLAAFRLSGQAGPRELAYSALAVTAAVFYLSPAQFPWYASWFIPFGAIVASSPAILASVLLPSYFLFFPLANQGRFELFMFGIAFIHAVPVLGWWFFLGLRRWKSAS